MLRLFSVLRVSRVAETQSHKRQFALLKGPALHRALARLCVALSLCVLQGFKVSVRKREEEKKRSVREEEEKKRSVGEEEKDRARLVSSSSSTASPSTRNNARANGQHGLHA